MSVLDLVVYVPLRFCRPNWFVVPPGKPHDSALHTPIHSQVSIVTILTEELEDEEEKAGA